MSKRISASIVTYNSQSDILNILESLNQCKLESEIDIYVVDNASSDKTVDIVKQNYPEVSVIELPKNIGFGAGHNIVINMVESDYHIIVNPDIFVHEGSIADLSTYMDNNPNIAIASPKIMNTDGTEQYLPKRYPKMKYFLGGRFEKYGKLFKKWRAEYTRCNENISQPTEIDFCTGCFMFCRTSSLKSVGGFDERYFLHFEDADLTREMKKVGKTMFVPYIIVTHEWKRENGKAGKVFRIALKSMYKYLRKWK